MNSSFPEKNVRAPQPSLMCHVDLSSPNPTLSRESLKRFLLHSAETVDILGSFSLDPLEARDRQLKFQGARFEVRFRRPFRRLTPSCIADAAVATLLLYPTRVIVCPHVLLLYLGRVTQTERVAISRWVRHR